MNITHNQMDEAINNTCSRLLRRETAGDMLVALRILREELDTIKYRAEHMERAVPSATKSQGTKV